MIDYFYRVLLTLDILLSVITLGYLGETISSRSGKGKIYGGRPWIWFAPIIDYVFDSVLIPDRWRGPEHCLTKIQWHKGRSYFEVRSKHAYNLKKFGTRFRGIRNYYEITQRIKEHRSPAGNKSEDGGS